MPTNFVQELQWRGLLHDIMPETETFLLEKSSRGYIGFDPTADSLHIGSLVQIMILMHFQRHGHAPIILVGGATGMIGDPSGKSDERNLLDQVTLEKNCTGIQNQLERFLDFDSSLPNPAILVNNYDWMKSYSLIDFSREVGKHITVNYMMAKESVKKRLSSEAKVGMSFTEFTYQLLQGYDFLHLFKTLDCRLQMGGSDQWGNITTGTELIRRKEGGKAYAITCPLIKKADGSKFGKTEGGNIWLDKKRTSPYKFYQFWLNTSDEDALNYIKIFTFLSQDEINSISKEHAEAPHQRLLQNTIANEVTTLVHGLEELQKAQEASQILFGRATSEAFQKLTPETFLELFEGVPQANINRKTINEGLDIIAALSSMSGFLSSNSDARRALKENAISVNKTKVDQDFMIQQSHLIGGQYVLLQRGKKNYFVLKIVD
ncbi:tyrosine--tRNA ligase [Flavobacteriaceae bacterium]|jgi:tyrosyl-tRNA synthetase|nr:tyrosine--tRNA ligase [Flavobacteriaceae bacterium]MBT4313175.1 tyrosine--tRNA ligase [Flavobacteriaceae bacterium]MBT5091218.1 tyrosine--tRNA ligase [Flavobacteriaceae bacterium]MBT5282885.1 tyrosine--tRNA ligase [Flavobacteriaceae bacterium]MBT5446586.1 tyrosine--tRNA ligase [Flavobacteriaceae bacterium]|tara:strand:+ start:1419 stop:2717 length:1299 start_codon:yes stop_codon:yes gene_type:complete